MPCLDRYPPKTKKRLLYLTKKKRDEYDAKLRAFTEEVERIQTLNEENRQFAAVRRVGGFLTFEQARKRCLSEMHKV
jgi:hypothetical protein